MDMSNIWEGFMQTVQGNWIPVALGFLVGKAIPFNRVAGAYVAAIREYVPKPFKIPLLKASNDLAKEIDRQIPDDLKVQGGPG